jgi:hypothetical protein
MNPKNFARSIIWKIADSTFLRARPTSVSQNVLLETYRTGSIAGLPAPDWRGLGFRTQSQNDEDGYLLYIFAVEVCCGDGRESNTANLILYHGCTGLPVDGDHGLAKQARQFYSGQPNTMYRPPKIVHRWVTAGKHQRVVDRERIVRRYRSSLDRHRRNRLLALAGNRCHQAPWCGDRDKPLMGSNRIRHCSLF